MQTSKSSCLFSFGACKELLTFIKGSQFMALFQCMIVKLNWIGHMFSMCWSGIWKDRKEEFTQLQLKKKKSYNILLRHILDKTFIFTTFYLTKYVYLYPDM